MAPQTISVVTQPLHFATALHWSRVQKISCEFMPFQEGLMASEVVDEQRSRKSDLPFEVMGKTDEKFSEFAAAESTVSEKQDLIDLVNELQNKLSEAGQSLNISLPQIVVVGCQSAGKSSVLENIVGREFLPRGAGTVTKRPLIVQLQPCDKEYAVFHHKPNENFVDFQEVKKEIESETEKEVGDGTFSSKPINLKIFSPNVLKLTLVDLPGLIKNPLVNQSEGIVQEVRDMVKSYISQENSLILAISPANQDIANSDSLNIAKTVDPDRERTIGVLTKLDIMDMGTDAREILENKVIPLKRGYIGIVNRSQNDIEENRDIKYILEKEKCFFHSHRKYRHMANRMGTPFLQEFLHKQLRAHIQTSLPSVKSELDEKYHSCFKELSDLNEKLGYTDKASKNIFMIRLINQFEDNLRLRLEGQSERVELEKISAGARMNYVFYTEIQELLNQDLLPGDEKLINAIANINGFRTGIAVPSLAFDAICRLLIEQYKTPMERAVSTIADILAGAVKESAETVSRYPSLKNEILYLVCDEIKEEENKTKNNLKKHIEAEMYFFNLGHPDFESSILQQVAPTAGPIKIWDENCDVEESQTHEEILKKKLMMNEATKKKVNYISAMISKYMEIIRKNISDVTVKYIMFFLVKRVLDFAKQDLLGILLESGKTDQLLKESEADVQRKLELENTCRAITNALQVVKNF